MAERIIGTVTSGDYTVTIAVDYLEKTWVHARVNDTSKTSYGAIPASVTYQGKTYRINTLGDLLIGDDYLLGCFFGCENLVTPPSLPATVTDLGNTFAGCSSLTTAPTIPASVVSMLGTFTGCGSLTSAPVIPAGVADLRRCFNDCRSLTSAPVIPAGVTDLRECFQTCLALTGPVTINANANQYANIFQYTRNGIWLIGSSSQLQVYADTATNGNVFVGEIPLSYNLTAERVSADGGTVPAAEGEWLHLILNTSWSNFAANSLNAIALQDNGSSVTPTWYTDAAKTGAIVLPGWQPSSVAEAHAWVPVNLTRHVLSLTVSDAYHTGPEISIVVPASFRTMDILAGGRGIAFGKVAENEGFECAMRASFSDNAGLMTALLDLIYPVGQYVWTSDADWDPNDIIGGTWELIPEGQALISAGTTYLAEQTYGANTKRIADANIAHGHGFTQPSVTGGGGDATGNMSANSSHSHTVGYVNYKRATTTSATTAVSFAESSSNKSTSSESVQHTHKLPAHTHTVSGGSVSNLGTPSARTNFNVMQASQAAYCWHRTA